MLLAESTRLLSLGFKTHENFRFTRKTYAHFDKKGYSCVKHKASPSCVEFFVQLFIWGHSYCQIHANTDLITVKASLFHFPSFVSSKTKKRQGEEKKENSLLPSMLLLHFPEKWRGCSWLAKIDGFKELHLSSNNRAKIKLSPVYDFDILRIK